MRFAFDNKIEMYQVEDVNLNMLGNSPKIRRARCGERIVRHSGFRLKPCATCGRFSNAPI